MYTKFAKVIFGRGQEFARQMAAELDSDPEIKVIDHALVGNDEVAAIVVSNTPKAATFDTAKWPESDVPMAEVTIVGAAAQLVDGVTCELGTANASVTAWDVEADQAFTTIATGDAYTVKVVFEAPKKFLSTKVGINGGFVEGTLSDGDKHLTVFVEEVVALPAVTE